MCSFPHDHCEASGPSNFSSSARADCRVRASIWLRATMALSPNRIFFWIRENVQDRIGQQGVVTFAVSLRKTFPKCEANLLEPDLVESGVGGFAGESTVPAQKARESGIIFERRDAQELLKPLAGREVMSLCSASMSGRVSLWWSCLRVIDYGTDAVDAIGRSPFEADVVRIVIGNHFVVGGGDESVLRIEGVRQLRRRDEPCPFVAAVSGNGQQAGPVAHRRESDGVLADVAGIVGIDHIFRRNLPARHCRLELIPILGAVNGQGRQVTGRPRLASDPAQRECAFAVLPETGPCLVNFKSTSGRPRP